MTDIRTMQTPRPLRLAPDEECACVSQPSRGWVVYRGVGRRVKGERQRGLSAERRGESRKTLRDSRAGGGRVKRASLRVEPWGQHVLTHPPASNSSCFWILGLFFGKLPAPGDYLVLERTKPRQEEVGRGPHFASRGPALQLLGLAAPHHPPQPRLLGAPQPWP